MSRRILSRLVLAATLASALALAAPIQAQAAGPANTGPVLSWLTHLWQEGISALWSWSEATPPGGGATQSGPAPGTATDSSNGGSGDEGWGIDPNG